MMQLMIGYACAFAFIEVDDDTDVDSTAIDQSTDNKLEQVIADCRGITATELANRILHNR